jgi:hypothetical protein
VFGAGPLTPRAAFESALRGSLGSAAHSQKRRTRVRITKDALTVDIASFSNARTRNASSAPSVLTLKHPDTNEPFADANGVAIPGMTLTLRYIESDECRAAAKANRAKVAQLRLAGKLKELSQPDHEDGRSNKVIAAAFVSAGDSLTYEGAPIDSAEVFERLLTDPRSDWLRQQVVLFIADFENFPQLATPIKAPSAPSTLTKLSASVAPSASSLS